MPIVTLTTDYGRKDHYAAVLKGRLLSSTPEMRIVDISHEIEGFNIVQAAFVLGHAYQSFPLGTIHVALVHNRSSTQDLLAIKQNGHYFIMPDNGMVALLLRDIRECYRIPVDQDRWRTGIARLVAAIHSGDLTSVGEKTDSFDRKIHLSPVVTSNMIRGAAVHIDHYDNIVFNVTEDLFHSTSAGRMFELYYKRHEPVTTIHRNFYEVAIGEVVCRFNHLGYLEMGINMGRAASLFGIKIDDTVQVHFLDRHAN